MKLSNKNPILGFYRKFTTGLANFSGHYVMFFIFVNITMWPFFQEIVIFWGMIYRQGLNIATMRMFAPNNFL
jgi:hypothetical protein